MADKITDPWGIEMEIAADYPSTQAQADAMLDEFIAKSKDASPRARIRAARALARQMIPSADAIPWRKLDVAYACDTCKWFNADPSSATQGDGLSGECFYAPPTPIWGGGDFGQPTSMRPRVKRVDVCGHHALGGETPFS